MRSMNMEVKGAAELPPNSVRTAARLFAANFILFKIVVPMAYMGWGALQGGSVSPNIGPVTLLVLVWSSPFWVVSALIYFNIETHRNWVRGLLVISIFFGLYFLVMGTVWSGMTFAEFLNMLTS